MGTFFLHKCLSRLQFFESINFISLEANCTFCKIVFYYVKIQITDIQEVSLKICRTEN